MKRGNLKKWLLGIAVILSIFFMFGCEDTVTETVADTQAPIITPKELTVEYGDILNYSDMVSVTDDSSDAIQLSIANSNIDGIVVDEENAIVSFNVLGTYELTLSATDSAGNTSEAKVSVSVKDQTKPVLSLSQTTFSLVAGGAAPNYANIASANDNVDGNLTKAISVDTSKVNYNSPGTYDVIYTVSDSSGNEAVQIAKVTITAKQQTTLSNNTSSGTNESQVMITRTGECYHRRKCGNGTYFWVSFSEAQSRGLRPCQKCY